MESELKELKSELRAVVVSSPVALTAQALLRDYRQMMGVSLPISRFGYRDPITFLKEQCSDCFLFQGPAQNPTLTLIVPDTLKHIDKFVQKQKTALKGTKRRSVPESIINPPQKNLVCFTFSNKSNIKKTTINTSQSINLSTKVENDTKSLSLSNKIESNAMSSNAIQGGSRFQRIQKAASISKLGRGDVIAKKQDQSHSSLNNNRKDSGSYTDDHPANAVSNFLKKRMPLLESMQNLDLEDNNFSNIVQDKKSDRPSSDSGRHTTSSRSSSKQLKVETLKKEIFEIIDEHPEGVLCVDLISLYRQRHGKELDYSILGHMSLVSAALALGLRAAKSGGGHRLGRTTPPSDLRRRLPARQRAPSPACDADDALPGVAYDPDIFPTDCMQPSESIPRVDISWIQEGEYVDVLAAEVYSPSHLWLVLMGEQYHMALEKVMDDMNKYYKKGEGSKRSLTPGAVRVGHYCACLFENDWHRAMIVRVLDCDTVKVRHVDYATVQTVSPRSLRPLLRRYSALPMQAIRARLAGVRPERRARRWQPAAALCVLRLLRDTPHVAGVTRNQDDILEVYLINTMGEDDICCNEQLIREGHAEHAASPCGGAHLLPRFEPLETGAAPALHECLAYLRDGLELDYVADFRAHVPPLLPAPGEVLDEEYEDVSGAPCPASRSSPPSLPAMHYPPRRSYRPESDPDTPTSPPRHAMLYRPRRSLSPQPDSTPSLPPAPCLAMRYQPRCSHSAKGDPAPTALPSPPLSPRPAMRYPPRRSPVPDLSESNTPTHQPILAPSILPAIHPTTLYTTPPSYSYQNPSQPVTQYPPQPATQYPPQPATQYPPQLAAQNPPQPATQYPPQLATQYPPQPATQYPPQPATQYPPQPATQYPTQPATQYPPQPATQYPPHPATQYPPQPATHYPPQPATQYPPQPAAQYPFQRAPQLPYKYPTTPQSYSWWEDQQPVAPPPGFQYPANPTSSVWAGGGLSSTEAEMLQLISRVQPTLARRFVAERLNRDPRPPPPFRLNPLAPEFPASRY